MKLICQLSCGAVDSSGNTLSGGSAYIYKVGTTTLATIYSDRELTQPASNPVTLDDAGKAEVYTAEEVRLVLEDADGVEVDDIESLGSVEQTTTVVQSESDTISLLERIAISRKPNYYSSSDDVLTIPATNTNPAAVMINDVAYANYADQTCTMSESGRGGLDTGAIAANTIYYLYAIPSVDGVGWDAVASVTNPSTGPTGFIAWSYLGAFGTDSSKDIIPFRSVRGDFRFGGFPGSGYRVTVNNATPLASKTLNVPVTARHVHIQMIWAAVAAAGDDLFYAAKTGVSGTTLSNASSTTVANNPRTQDTIPIVTAKTAYFYVTTATSDSIYIDSLGWIEDPMEWN